MNQAKDKKMAAILNLMRVFSQSLVGQRDMLRAFIGALVEEPPDSNEDGQTAGHQTGVVHILRMDR